MWHSGLWLVSCLLVGSFCFLPLPKKASQAASNWGSSRLCLQELICVFLGFLMYKYIFVYTYTRVHTQRSYSGHRFMVCVCIYGRVCVYI